MYRKYMNKSRITLTLIYVGVIALGVFNYFSGNLHVKVPGSIIIIMGYIINVAAINGKGGELLRKLSFIFSGLMASVVILAGILLSFFSASKVEVTSFVFAYACLIGCLLAWTILFLRKVGSNRTNSLKLEELPAVLSAEAKTHLSDGYKLDSYEDGTVTMLKNKSITQKYYVYIKEQNGQAEVTTG